MVPIATRVPEAVAAELERRAKRAKKPPAELHRDVVVAAMNLDGTVSDALRTQPSEIGLSEKEVNAGRAKKGVAPVHVPQRTSVGRHPPESRLKGRTFKGPFPKAK